MKSMLFLLLCATSLAACAQDPSGGGKTAASNATPATQAPPVAPGSAAERARDAIHKLAPRLQIDRIHAAPLPGYQEVIAGGQAVYVSDDGKYLLQGAVLDLRNMHNYATDAMARFRREMFAKMPVSDRIVFAPPDPKYTVTVFTDVECAYCRKFHSQIAQYNKLGIAVQYVAFPRMGLGSDDFKEMVAVWCAPDRRQALTDAKHDRKVPYRNCSNPVAMQYDLGKRMGLTGTPMILAGDGTELGGYLSPEKLREALDRMADADAIPSPGAPAAGSH